MRKYLIIAVLAAIGIFNAFYLSIPAYQYWNGANSQALQMMPCDLTSTFSCSDILKHPRSIIFEIGGSETDCIGANACLDVVKSGFKVAFPMIAAVVYPILLIIALWGWFSKSYTPAKVLTAMAAGGILFNSYVIYQEFIVGVFCPLCAMCTVIIITIFILSISIWKAKKENWNAQTTH